MGCHLPGPRRLRVRRDGYLRLYPGGRTHLRLEEGSRQMGVMQQFNEPNMITTSTDKLFNWARKNSLWPLQFGLACCAIEMMSTGMAHNDLDRFGAGFFTASPRQAAVMIVSGTVSTKMAERMTRLYEQMPEPKWVIAMGACAISGGPFLDGYSVLMGADRVIPVDVYVPGCPPRPEALIFGIMTLQKKIERDQQVGYERPRPRKPPRLRARMARPRRPPWMPTFRRTVLPRNRPPRRGPPRWSWRYRRETW